MSSEIRDIVRSITKNSDDYDEKYMKVRFNLDEELPLNKTLEISSVAIVIRAVFMKITNTIYKFS